MDDNLHYLLKDKRYTFKLYKKCNSKKNLYNYNLARNKVSNKIKQMKRDKENKIAKNIKINPKAFYQYIASKTIVKEGVHELVNEDGKLAHNDVEKYNMINTFFSSVLTDEDASIYPVLNMIKMFLNLKIVL